MKIRSMHIRNFRSIQSTSVTACGNMNVLIGKNNAGKSNILASIDLMLNHLRQGAIAAPWATTRPADEFTDREYTKPLQIGIDFDLPSDLNLALRDRLLNEAPHLERSIEQIKSHSTIGFILFGSYERDSFFLFLQSIVVGAIDATSEELAADGIRLLSVSKSVAKELFSNREDTNALRADLRGLDGVLNDRRIEAALQESETVTRRYSLESLSFGRLRLRPELARQVNGILGSSSSPDDFKSAISQLVSETSDKISKIEKREIEGTISAFAGDTKSPPAYAGWLMEEYGKIPSLHLKEAKQPIGRDEALELLQLKVRRGGPDRLRIVQQTIRALLGVNVDAFEPESPRGGEPRGAEMDIDDFLVEANGAGIREALRLVLDLELKHPNLVLIEEPEVHLHPGLERAVESYLRACYESA